MRLILRSLGGKLLFGAAATALLCILLFLALSWVVLTFLVGRHAPPERVWPTLSGLGVFVIALGSSAYLCSAWLLVIQPLHRLQQRVDLLAARTPALQSARAAAAGNELEELALDFERLGELLYVQDAESQLLTQQLSDLLNMSDALISTLDLERLLAEIVTRLGVIMNVRQVSLLLYGRDKLSPWAVAHWTEQPAMSSEQPRGAVNVYTDPQADITMAATTKMTALPATPRPIPSAAKRPLLRAPRLRSPVEPYGLPRPRIPREAVRELDLLLARMAMQKQKIVYGEDVAAIYQERQESWARLALEAGHRAVIAAPLLLQDETIGAVMLYAEQPYQVTQRATFLLSTAAIQAAMALQDALLFAEVKEKNTALERVNHLKSQFLATVTHELRTPLHSIISYGSLLVDGFVEGELSAEQQEHIQFMIDRAEDLSHLVDDMLDLSKIEADRLEVRVEPLHLEPCLTEVVNQLRPLAQQKGLCLALEVEQGLPQVLADPQRLRQVLINMVSNAIKFTEQGGVTIRCTALERYDMLRIAVHDTGVGISPAALEYIFEAFRQADGSVSRRFSGTGLGLTIARKLIELQGGEVFVESAPGEGSTFSCILPIAPAAKVRQSEKKTA